MIAVVDASAMAALTFKEPAAAEVRDRLADRQIVAPHLLVYELLNTAAKKMRRHPDQAAAIRAGVERVLADDFAIYWSDVEPSPVIDLALQTGLTAYDASYLWLAKHLDAELVTLDAELGAAARRV
jgi:predicted nucleic acid-binding protein